MRRSGIIDGRDCRLCLFIHDELIFQVKEDRVPVIVPRIVETMANATALTEKYFGFSMNVPFAADASIGKNLADVEELDILSQDSSKAAA